LGFFQPVSKILSICTLNLSPTLEKKQWPLETVRPFFTAGKIRNFLQQLQNGTISRLPHTLVMFKELELPFFLHFPASSKKKCIGIEKGGKKKRAFCSYISVFSREWSFREPRH